MTINGLAESDLWIRVCSAVVDTAGLDYSIELADKAVLAYRDRVK